MIIFGNDYRCMWRPSMFIVGSYFLYYEYICFADATFSQDLNQAILDENHSKIARSLRDTSSIELLFSCVRRYLLITV